MAISHAHPQTGGVRGQVSAQVRKGQVRRQVRGWTGEQGTGKETGQSVGQMGR